MGEGEGTWIEQEASKHGYVYIQVDIIWMNSSAVTSFLTPVSNIPEGSFDASGCCLLNLRNTNLIFT